MQITISDKLIAQAVGHMLDGSIYDYFDKDVIKAAGVPKRADAIKSIMEDKKFQTYIAREIARNAEDLDMLVDYAYEADNKIAGKLVNECERVYDAVADAQAAQRQKAELKRIIALLESEGYTVAKKQQATV